MGRQQETVAAPLTHSSTSLTLTSYWKPSWPMWWILPAPPHHCGLINVRVGVCTGKYMDVIVFAYPPTLLTSGSSQPATTDHTCPIPSANPPPPRARHTHIRAVTQIAIWKSCITLRSIRVLKPPAKITIIWNIHAVIKMSIPVHVLMYMCEIINESSTAIAHL